MDSPRAALEQFLFEVFHRVLRTEERMLSQAQSDLSLREVHLIAEVCQAVDSGRDNRATAIAAAQHITAGTLTSAVSLLERKGYLERRRDSRDRRIVRILPTERGRAANERHARFHRELMEQILSGLPGDEAAAFVQGLKRISAFFSRRDPALS